MATVAAPANLTELLHEKREDILRIANCHGALNVRVFGSISRGESGPNSDVDFLVDVGPQHSSWFPAGLIVDLEDLLGRRVDVATSEALHWYIRDHISYTHLTLPTIYSV